MKTKQRIYFICIALGILLLALGNRATTNLYLQSVGFIFLMLGIYAFSRTQNPSREAGEKEITKKNHGQF